MARRLKVTTNRDVPLWGATKTKSMKLQRERDLANEVHALKEQVAAAKGATSHYANAFHKAKNAMPSDHRIVCLGALVKMPIKTCVELGIVPEMTVLAEWHADLMKAIETAAETKSKESRS